MTDKVTQVNDRPAELWIKVLSLFAMITIPMVGTIGYLNNDRQNLIIEGQAAMIIALKEVNRTLNIFNVRLENHEGRISRTEGDVRDIKMILPKFKLKEKYNGR